jgi:hypothetical protein
MRATAAEAGRLRSVAMARAEMIFDIDDDSIVKRAFDGSHVDCLPECCWVLCDDDHRMSLF